MSEFTREQAIADLRANPAGSYREFMTRWSWPYPRVQRLLRSIEKAGICSLERSKSGTRARFTDDSGESGESAPPDSLNPQSRGESAIHPPDSPRHLDTGSLDLSRDEESRYTERLIDAANAALAGIYGTAFTRISADNFGSHRAGQAFIHAGIPFEFARDRLVEDCRRFNPSKHGRGELPKSVGLFTRGILRAWNRRAQLELGIPPQLKVDRTDLPVKEQIAPKSGEKRDPVSLQSMMEAFIEGQASRGVRG
jgi:hypothetical protein